MREPVEIWTVALDPPEPEVRRLYGLLSPAERERAGAPPLDLRKQLDYPVLEYFAADEPGLRMLLGQLREMLAAAETDL